MSFSLKIVKKQLKNASKNEDEITKICKKMFTTKEFNELKNKYRTKIIDDEVLFQNDVKLVMNECVKKQKRLLKSFPGVCNISDHINIDNKRIKKALEYVFKKHKCYLSGWKCFVVKGDIYLARSNTCMLFTNDYEVIE